MPEATWKSLAHSRWECKYHVVFIPKYRRKALYGESRQSLGAIFHELARQKECRIVEGHLLADPVHIAVCTCMCPKITPFGLSVAERSRRPPSLLFDSAAVAATLRANGKEEGTHPSENRCRCGEIPPQYAVASVIGFLKGKSSLAIARQFGGKIKNFTGEHFWARGSAVSTVGYELEAVKRYIREQETEDQSGRF
jgi:REP-associated tyrosine transposase